MQNALKVNVIMLDDARDEGVGKMSMLSDALYERFGAFSKKAHEIILKMDTAKSLGELTFQTGYAYRLVKEVCEFYSNNIANEQNSVNYEENNVDVAAKLIDKTNIRKVLSEIKSSFNYNNRNLDHISATAQTLLKRTQLLCTNLDVSRCKILFLGDHDLTSIALALSLKDSDYNIYVVDVDESVLSYIVEIAKRYNLNIITAFADLRNSIPNFVKGKMDAVFTDPPFTPDGIELFAVRAMECVKRNDFSNVYLCYKTAETSPALGVEVQKKFIKQNIYISELIPDFNEYDAAEALGYRSDLYLLKPTSKTYVLAEQFKSVKNIYTHGLNAVESLNGDSVDALANELIVAIKNETKSEKYLLIETHDTANLKDVDAQIMTASNFIQRRINGTLNVKKSSKIFYSFLGNKSFVDAKMSFLLATEDFYMLIDAKSERLFLNDEVIKFISSIYSVSHCYNTHNFKMMRFSKKLPAVKERCFYEIMNYPKSTIKNAFVNVLTDNFNYTKNQARELFDELDVNQIANHTLYEAPLCWIEYFKAKLDKFEC